MFMLHREWCTDYLVLQVVPSYEHGELILKNFKETLIETGPATVFTPGGDPNTSAVLPSKDVVYSEVCMLLFNTYLLHLFITCTTLYFKIYLLHN